MSQQDEEQANLSHSLFDAFLHAKRCKDVLDSFEALCRHLGLEHTGQLQFYHKLKSCLNYWSAKALWTKLDKKSGHRDYDQGTACANTKCLIIGAGPCGLRSAIELAFLGAQVVVVEKRDAFSRNNVLHLWPFTIQDLRALGAKKFYGHFCTGSLDHISIRQLQLILLKVALLLGVQIHTNVQFKGLVPPAASSSEQASGWRAILYPSSSPLSQYEFDVLISAGGGRFVPEGFKRKETRGKLAIGITTNFINNHSRAEVEVAEISGVARIYNQKFFQNLYNKTDDTHYFVMTAKKQSLLKKGVILKDKLDIESLLSPENVNPEALLAYAKEAANFSTNYQLPNLQFALNHRNQPDVDMFDFTCMSRSDNAALVRDCNGKKLLIGLVGDCLVEPFWPLGTGVGRGFLAAFDAAWMVKRWASGIPPLDVLAERESLYQRLSQTSPDNTNKNINQYSIDPITRYPNINLQAIKASQVRNLYVTGEIEMDQKKRRSRGSLEIMPAEPMKNSLAGVKLTQVTIASRDFSSLNQNDPIGNNQLALDVAEQELGISPVLSSTEMASMSEPEQLGLITYLSQFYDAFKNFPGRNSQDPEEKTAKPLTPRGTKGAILFLSKLQKSLSLSRKRNLSPPVSPVRSSDACYICGKRVYIVERVSAEGRFFHRGCFKCYHCNFYCSLHIATTTDMVAPSSRTSVKTEYKVCSPSDKGILDVAVNEDRMEIDSRQQSPSSFTNQPPTVQLEKSQKSAGEGSELSLSRENGGVAIIKPSQHLHQQPSLAKDEKQQNSNFEANLASQVGNQGIDVGRAYPKKAAHDLRSWIGNQLQEEAHGDLVIGMQGASINPVVPRKLTAPSPVLEQGECGNAQRRMIRLSTLEKCELSRLSPISASFNFPDESLEESSKDSEDFLEIGSESEEEEEEEEEYEPGSLDLGAEISIQRRLEEIEVTFRELEKQGVRLERCLQEVAGTESELKREWMNQLLSLVQKKNSLMCEESDLMIAVQELKLEEQQCQLDQELRQYYNMNGKKEHHETTIPTEAAESSKTLEDQQVERKILSQLLEVVNQRSALIEMQEKKRLSELSEHVPMLGEL
ncbi:hypothetical protein JD844_018222 [Phrynosoma platyrhinos]|uniref:L-amino-acid oxidase n=1 Tax=Phrynosoma platyrhinos TaxID=52577 RepID=A0ABQ7SN32_PHRPL|nr:hypothetical protein JD844_018222 [Phrynosoma platyrhinos]